MWVRLADESVCIGPAPAAKSYLHIPAIIAACEITGAQAVHPGYGFLSENARFAEIVDGARLHLHRPQARAHPHDGRQDHRQAGGEGRRHPRGARLRRRGDHRGGGLGRRQGDRLPGADQGRRRRRRARHEGRQDRGRPGRGRPDRPLRGQGRLRRRRGLHGALPPDARAISSCRSSPTASATSATWANATARCSAATRRCWRKPPRPALDAAARAKIGKVVVDAIKAIGYLGVGTIEFLYENGEFFFIEMNTRLQVEHPVTEAITGIDLVREQIRIAAGLPLSFTQDDVGLRRPRHRMPDQRREPEDLRAVARPGHRLSTPPAAWACAWIAPSTPAIRSRPTTTA